ncbi:MAG TPA: NAD(P)-dependent oxidoreductase [Chloroflexota bacterium]|jgi:nucleoside-diphosphate-sugar epimerase
MPTLITGAGLVGSAVAARLIAEYSDEPVLYDVRFREENLRDHLDFRRATLVQGDLGDADALHETMCRYRVDRLVHTAGLLAQAVREQPVEGARVNVLGSLSVLQAARRVGARRLVYCGSVAVALGLRRGAHDVPVGEDFALHTESEYPPSLYSAMKLATEWLGREHEAQHGVEFVSLRLSGVFGRWRGSNSGMAGQVVQRLMDLGWRGEVVPVTAAELQRPANYVYAADAAQAAVRALMAERLPHRVYNVAMERNYSVAELAPLVEAALGRAVELDVRGEPSAQPPAGFPLVDTRRVRQDLGWTLEFPMERALRDYVAWRRSPTWDAGPIS